MRRRGRFTPPSVIRMLLEAPRLHGHPGSRDTDHAIARDSSFLRPRPGRPRYGDAPPSTARTAEDGLQALTGPETPLRKGDTVAFFGDSITMQGDGEKGYLGLLRAALAGAEATTGAWTFGSSATG